jgi:hypothetical protein
MKTLIAAIAVALAALGAPTVSGTWSMSIDSPHGNMKASLALKQDGTKVTGTFRGPMPDAAVEGTFENGKLKIETSGAAEHMLVFEAKLREDGTLAGYLSSDMGDMNWTARRVE